MTIRKLRICYFLVLTGFTQHATTAVMTGTDETAQLPFWQWSDQSVSIRLVQRLPDQSRAYFTARKFSSSDAERIAQSCVFQTVFKNIASTETNTVIRYDLTQWQIQQNGTKHKLKVKEQWMAEWQQSQAPKSAQIAFAWSLLPTNQQYRPGDYNWGMTTYNLRPGQRFDLTLVWHENEHRRSALIPNIQCAADLQISPPNGIAN
ncbi:hypothetical protein [Kaarinaea lacus]